MTASGSSAADALHHLYDQTSAMLGFGQPEQQQQDGSAEQEGQGKEGSSSKAEEGSNGAMEGPGNHPEDESNPMHGSGVRSSQDNDRGESTQKAGYKADEPDTDRRKTQSGKQADALERAMGEEGPIGQQMGAPIDRELRNDLYARKRNEGHDGEQLRESTKAAAGAAVGEPLQSGRNRPKDAAKEREEGQAGDEGEQKSDTESRREEDQEGDKQEQAQPTAQHPHQKGPEWASRPDDAQRRKLKEAAAERRRQDSSKESTWKRLVKGNRQQSQDGAGEGEQADKAQGPLNIQGIDLLRDPKENEERARRGELVADKVGKGEDGDGAGDENGDNEKEDDQTGAPSRPPAKSRGSSHLSQLFVPSSQKSPKPSSPSQPQSQQPSPSDRRRFSWRGQASPSAGATPGEGQDTPAGADSSTQAKMTRISKLMMGSQSRSSSMMPAPQQGGAEPRDSDANEGSGGDDQQDETVQGVDGVVHHPNGGAAARWGVLRQRLKENRAKRSKTSESKSRVVGQMSIVTELQSGILPVFLLKMSLERDEAGHRRIPVLLNHLRLKITDSINIFHNTHAIFRIELEYGDGLVKWVCYRSLRDFINLHTHYRAAALRGYLGRQVGAGEGDVGLPSFPKTSLPYFNQLKQQGWTKNSDNIKADFAKAQRDSLEDYIIELIKRTMFRPEANRLCKFFEISALGMSLATRGGYQGKQGYLRILSRSSRKDAQRGILTPVSWVKSHDPKWFIVRESYIAIVDEPDTLQVHDVFLIDGSFEIERPKRLYKQTMHLAHELGGHNSGSPKDRNADEAETKADGAEEASGNGKKELNGDLVDSSPNTRMQRQTSHRRNASAPTNNGNGTSNDEDVERRFHTEKVRGKKSGRSKAAAFEQEEGDSSSDDDDVFEGQSGNRKRSKDDPNANVSSHTFYIRNAERKLKVVARNERQMDQFIASMDRVARRNIFSRPNRFGSFAPIRLNCNAQWLVDGRDYFWQVSRALLRAKDRIFIHDWWLSPELYLRRPGHPKYRLDNILKKKAEEGVKIFVIIYNEVSNNFTPTDSNYTKQRLIGLHRNIYVQRSPSHFQTGTFYWAHHEKLCVVDETIAFMGGLDLCFGRWDTSSHVLTDKTHSSLIPGNAASANEAASDEGPAPASDPALLGPGANGKEFYVWPGQDFANERVIEWHDLTKPQDDLFERHKHPRMPWHDVALQLIGQPARDLCRHFTQRWNFLLRIKNHKRLMPFLIPPPDFQPSELKKFDLTGTCEAQILRSAGPWSLGTASTVEHSIQNAYLKAIQMSEHFVYIENQFFVTSTETRGTTITNQIGEALVSRIIRAHREQTPWRAVIIIPSIPGFPMPIDHPDASSVRLIVELQYRSICTGEHSIFGKLRREGIDPDNYITFFALRQWGRLPGGQLTTEQVYIHAKAMVVDDRLALIGSANINERSQRGDRDSELACVVRDTDLIDSTMAGKPFKVGRFAHTLRMRLMREHLGIDVDEIDAAAAEEMDRRPSRMLDEDDHWDPAHEQGRRDDPSKGTTQVHSRKPLGNLGRTVAEAVGPMTSGARQEAKDEISNVASKMKEQENAQLNRDDEESQHPTNRHDRGEAVEQPISERIDRIVDIHGAKPGKGSESTVVPTVEERLIADDPTLGPGTADGASTTTSHTKKKSGEDLKRAMSGKMSINPWAPPASTPEIDADMFEDPLDDRFFKDMWLASAVHNTQIFRKVFKCVPDDTVTTWAEYKAFNAWAERLARSTGSNSASAAATTAANGPSSLTPAANGGSGGGSNTAKGDKANSPQFRPQSEATHVEEEDKHDSGYSSGAGGLSSPAGESGHSKATDGASLHPSTTHNGSPAAHEKHLSSPSQAASLPPKHAPKPDDGFTKKELDQMEALLEETRGTLILFSTRFLEAEDRSDNLLFPMDKINPLNVYD